MSGEKLGCGFALKKNGCYIKKQMGFFGEVKRPRKKLTATTQKFMGCVGSMVVFLFLFGTFFSFHMLGQPDVYHRVGWRAVHITPMVFS